MQLHMEFPKRPEMGQRPAAGTDMADPRHGWSPARRRSTESPARSSWVSLLGRLSGRGPLLVTQKNALPEA